ncbi:MAG: hypothetical protein RID42_04925 [Alphaproteobacteria bacterium]
MDNKERPLGLADFEALLDRCGPDPVRWPVELRAAAQTLVAQSTEAAAALHTAEKLARLLDLVAAPAPSAALEARLAKLPGKEDVHWIWMIVARPAWRPALLAAAMLGGVYLGAATLPTVAVYGDSGFDFASVAGGGETLGIVEGLEE